MPRHAFLNSVPNDGPESTSSVPPEKLWPETELIFLWALAQTAVEKNQKHNFEQDVCGDVGYTYCTC